MNSNPVPRLYAPLRSARTGLRLGFGLLALILVAAACGDSTIETAQDAAREVEQAVEEQEGETGALETDLATALENAGLGTLATAVSSVDVSDLVDGEEFTFFAPNDDAFLELSADEMADLLADQDGLLDILKNHVVAERLDAAALGSMTSVKAESGDTLEISEADGSVVVGGATVVSADLDVDKGIVHTVDRIILGS